MPKQTTPAPDKTATLGRRKKDAIAGRQAADKLRASIESSGSPDFHWPAEYGPRPARAALAVRFLRRRSEDLLRALEDVEDEIGILRAEQRQREQTRRSA